MTYALLVPTMIDLLLSEGALRDADPACCRTARYRYIPTRCALLWRRCRTRAWCRSSARPEASPIPVLSAEDHVLAATERPDLLRRSVGRSTAPS